MRTLCIIINRLEPGTHSVNGSVKYRLERNSRTITKGFRNLDERLNFDSLQRFGRNKRNPNLLMMRVGEKRDYWYPCKGL